MKITGAAERKLPPRARPKPALGSQHTLATIEARAHESGFRRNLPAKRRYVFTAAQNATPVHEGFFKALRNYCQCNDAELVIMPFRYRKDPKDSWWYAEGVTPHAFAKRAALNDHIGVMADVHISPTRVNPLSGMDAMSYASSAIFAHPKVELRTVAVPGERPKILTTTGAVTLPNYVEGISSKIAEFHHTFGAAVVEVAGEEYFIRQINADGNTGEFTDLNTVYSATSTRNAPRAAAVVLGDSHVGFIDPGVQHATFGPGGIVSTLNPEHIVYHDLLDGYSVNPHHRGDPFNALAKRMSGWDNVREEVERACRYVTDNTPGNAQAVIVSSNHDDFFRRWIVSADWRSDPVNMETYLSTALDMVRATTMEPSGTAKPSPFHLWAKRLIPDVLIAGGAAAPFELKNIVLGLHGDIGPNGARGSIRNLRRMGRKVIIGHSHSPGISEGAMQTGTSSVLRLEYNHGPSSWAHAHAVLYASGKRSLLFISNGRWRA